jgi:branched-chain amino acid transport system substrate-binding protein
MASNCYTTATRVLAKASAQSWRFSRFLSRRAIRCTLVLVTRGSSPPSRTWPSWPSRPTSLPYRRFLRGAVTVLIVFFLLLLGSGSAWLYYQQYHAPVRVGIGIDLPLIAGSAIDPSDKNTADLFVAEQLRTRIRIHEMFTDPAPERAAPDIQAAIDAGVRFFVLTQASSHAVPSLHLFADGRALGIHVASTSLQLSDRNDYLLRIIPDLRQEQQAIADWMATLPGKRLLVLQDLGNLPYTDPAFAIFTERLTATHPWQITHHKLMVSTFDPAEIHPLVTQEFDALYLLAGAFMPPIGNIAQYFHVHHPHAPIFLTTWARSPGVLEHSGDAIERLRMLSIYPSQHDDLRIANFFQRFRNRFEFAPQAMSISTWQALELFDAAFEAGHVTPAAVKEYLLSIPEHTTSFGPLRFDRYGEIQGVFHPLENLEKELQ